MKGIEYNFFDMVEIKTCKDNLHAYKTHMHTELSLGFITKGSTVLDINGTRYCFKEGEAVIIYPFTSHKCQPIDINNWEYTMIYLDPDICKFKDTIGVKRLRGKSFEMIRELSEFLKSDASRFDKEIAIVSVLESIVEENDIEVFLQSSEIMENVKHYIEDNFLSNIQLADIEEKFNIDKFSLIKNFKKQFNTTPNAYQLQLKVNYGKHLLSESNDLADVALTAGFYDQAHFTREFKKSYGVTPLQYYKNIH